MIDVTPVIAIFDVGKTNKKLFLFNEQYKIVQESSACFDETIDEDGDPCEDIDNLGQWILNSLKEVINLPQYELKAVNFSAYGASFVYLDEAGKILTPLYSYLKPYPDELKQRFYQTYGDEATIAMQTASPALGNLNSGLQLYRLKQEQPGIYQKVQSALHLPQYLSYLLTNKAFSDLTSIGCHTVLWNFNKGDYHNWVQAEGLTAVLAPVMPGNKTVAIELEGHQLHVGIGLHDSSAALIPYLVSFNEPFVLLSTGTWNISLNPFNQLPLTADELANDTLKYMQYQGLPVKASRLFAGYQYEQQTKRIAEYFGQEASKYKYTELDTAIISRLTEQDHHLKNEDHNNQPQPFSTRDLHAFTDDTEAYHQLMMDLVAQQKYATELVIKGTPVKQLFVDGGFSKNPVFMQLLASAFPELKVFAASVAQATAVGAALAVHQAWNTLPQPNNLIELKHYPA